MKVKFAVPYRIHIVSSVLRTAEARSIQSRRLYRRRGKLPFLELYFLSYLFSGVSPPPFSSYGNLSGRLGPPRNKGKGAGFDPLFS